MVLNVSLCQIHLMIVENSFNISRSSIKCLFCKADSSLCYYIGAYVGLPAPAANKRYSAMLVSPPIVKPSAPICVTFAYSTQGSSTRANGVIRLYYRQAGTTTVKSTGMTLNYNIPGTWNLEQRTVR